MGELLRVMTVTGVLLVVELRSQNSELHSTLIEDSAFEQVCCINTRVGALVVSTYYSCNTTVC